MTLKLTVFGEVFDLIITGEKKEEVRRDSQWIRSRLFDKAGAARKYDRIQFINGYKKDSACCICEFKGFIHADVVHFAYSNGLTIDIKNELVWVINTGDVLSVSKTQF